MLHPPIPAPHPPPPEGRFGAVRRHDVHTGLDLYCPPGAPVAAMEAGTVVAVEPFTGAHVPPPDSSPWWRDTWAVLVEGPRGVIVYGEIHPAVRPGDPVAAGQILGEVIPVLRRDKGRPTAMLHLEWMRPGARQTRWWRHGEPPPPELHDPAPLMEGLWAPAP